MDHLDEVIRDFRNLAGFVSVRRFSRLVLSGLFRAAVMAHIVSRAPLAERDAAAVLSPAINAFLSASERPHPLLRR
jgi:hypothetical protein